ncbi:PAS domain S-box protein [Candidatus Poribacteria bacterium]|nr:PAS domain S-box protein [Candidatus Poribacteria bacterium]
MTIDSVKSNENKKRMIIEGKLKKAKAAVLESEKQYRILVENANEAIVVVQDGMLKFVNPKAIEITGYSEEELLTKVFTEFIHKEDRQMVLQRHLKRLKGENLPHVYPFRIVAKNGLIRWVEVNAVVIDWQGKKATLNFMSDITERVKSEQALRESENRYRELADLLPQTVFETDIHGNVTFANVQAFKSTGYSQKDIDTGFDAMKLFLPEDQESILKLFNKVLDEKEDVSGEYNILRKGGSIFPAIIYLNPVVRSGKSVGTRGILIDITERKKNEEEILKVQKLESINLMASGIAHDFNNFLTVIINNLSLVKLYKDGDDLQERIIDAENAAIQAAKLTKQLLTLSKNSKPEKKITNIVELVRDSINLTLSGSNVKYHLSMPDGLWFADIDVEQIQRVISNIIINADQAMSNGGKIVINLNNISKEDCNFLQLEPRRYIKISITDNGIGISDEHLKRIFDPYFSTKQKGSGLGLATAYSIVKSHGGTIKVESKINVGSTFHIYLPASDANITIEKADPKPVKRPIKGQGKILVMDDEMRIRELLEEMLSSFGYSVTTAFDGVEAIELYRKAKESEKPFDVVIMDLTIPGGMGGKEAIKRLLEYDPEIKAIVSSGYSNNPIMSDYKRYGFVDVIPKPYHPTELSQVVHRVIEK